MTFSILAFIAGASVSLSCSWVLVTRLERIGDRFGLSEALLGVVAALAADAPEITSAISALSQHQRNIGAGVVVGSNLFNLAALLGLGALVSGFIALHRNVVILSGFVATWIALCCVATSTGLIGVQVGLASSASVLLLYVAVLGMRHETFARIPMNKTARNWLLRAVDEEALELAEAIHPPRGRAIDAVVAAVTLFIVVVSSVAMERGATEVGHQYRISGAIIGGVVLAAVTSLPNAVAAIHLASKGRGAAAFSTALNSNNLNVVVGLFIPGVIVGLARPSLSGNFTSVSYLVLTSLVVAVALVRKGLSRRAGVVIVAGYAIFVGCLVAFS